MSLLPLFRFFINLKRLRLALFAPLLVGLTGCTGVPDGIRPVTGFELNRYLGTWHEIARLDHRFERGLSDISANYSLLPDGGVEVLNVGVDEASGKRKVALGRAYFTGASDVASLKVSFFGPFYGGYHVFALDPEYRWAMVSGPSKKYFWILARQTSLPADVLDNLVSQARRAGFDTDKLIFPTHAQGVTP